MSLPDWQQRVLERTEGALPKCSRADAGKRIRRCRHGSARKGQSPAA